MTESYVSVYFHTSHHHHHHPKLTRAPLNRCSAAPYIQRTIDKNKIDKKWNLIKMNEPTSVGSTICIHATEFYLFVWSRSHKSINQSTRVMVKPRSC